MIIRHMHYAKQNNSNPNTLNFGSVLNSLEHQVNEHSLQGMFFAFIAGILGNIQHIPVTPRISAFDAIVKVAASMSILFGCLIGAITLVVKIIEIKKMVKAARLEKDDRNIIKKAG